MAQYGAFPLPSIRRGRGLLRSKADLLGHRVIHSLITCWLPKYISLTSTGPSNWSSPSTLHVGRVPERTKRDMTTVGWSGFVH